ncbi:MAG TPA: hypothetical protein VNZ64_09650 [Candidatus Acidoferrum sp.]|jgi:hypothetical protein|nr:hypothetical protein [Candidatus Acidoferrum sp.]
MPKGAYNVLGSRAVVFALAWLSFGCLLGQFYGVWTMHFFGCWILPPATVLLAISAYVNRNRPFGLDSPHTWIVQGAIAGIVAAVAYDLYRLPFVLAGAPLFEVFPRFGELLLGGTEPQWLVQGLGWTYHFSNGAALGIMFLVMASCFRRPMLFWGAVTWAVFVEAMLLLTPYATFFGLKLNGRFLFLTASAHVIFGIVLGLYCRAKLGRRLTAAG